MALCYREGMSRYPLTVVMPTYNRLSLLRWSLPALLNQRWDGFELVIVDDGSRDGTAEWLQALAQRQPRLHPLILPENQGRVVARNAGIEVARGELVLFIDSDVIVDADCVGRHWRQHLQLGRGWICQGGMVQTEHLPPLGAPSLWSDASRAQFATGNVSVARQALYDAGGFDPNFQEYGWEDLELGLRLRQQGFKTYRLTSAWGYHYEPAIAWDDLPTLIAKEQARGRGGARFWRKHPILEVAFMVQHTPLHRWLDGVVTGHGSRLERFWWPKLAQLRRRGHDKLALALLRAMLSHYSLKALEAELQTQEGRA